MEPMTGLEIRDAEAGDYEAYVRLFAELGLDDAPVSASKFAQEMAPNSAFAERGGRVVGFTFWRPLADTTHLSHIVSAPEARRTGAGRALLLDVLARAKARGAAAVTLNVDPRNVAARTLYESAGFRALARSRALRLTWDRVPAQGSGAKAIEPADDERLERRFELARGTFAEHRRQPDRVLRQLDTGTGGAAAIFDVAFPGCSPFRATDAAHALALLDALRPHARPEHAFLNLALEHQVELADALIAAGATLRFDFLKMRAGL